MKQVWLIWFIAIAFPGQVMQAQDKNDTIVEGKEKEEIAPITPYHWNVIKFNPTPMLLWSSVRNITISYERLIKKDMSVSLQTGFLTSPNIANDTIADILLFTDRTRLGINLSFDYRYYPLSRNRRPAPDGLYVGGYFSYYGISFKNEFDILNTTLDQQGKLDANINIINLGFELGYQFIFWKRFSVDLLLFGPSYSCFYGNAKITGQLDPGQVDDINKEMADKLLERFPLLENVFSSEGLQVSGTKSDFNFFFRYSIQLGFHF